MTVLIYLIPIALLLGLIALFGFLWALKSGQYEDLDGEASRILFDDEPPASSTDKPSSPGPSSPDEDDNKSSS